MIARRSRNDPALLLIGRKLCERVACAAFLEASRPLQVVQLAEDFHPRDFTEWDGGRTRGIVNRVRNSFARRFDVLKCEQAFNSRVLPAQLLIGQSESGTGCNLRNPSPAGDRI